MEEVQLQEVESNNQEVELTEVSQQLSELVETLQAEQQLKAEEQAKLLEEQALLEEQKVLEEQQQAELEEQQEVEFQEQMILEEQTLQEEQEYRQALLDSLNFLNEKLDEQTTILVETKDLQQEMSGHLVYGADSLIIYACLIPLFYIVKVLSSMFNRAL